MKLGGDRKKLMLLGGLVLFGAYLFYSNVLSDSAPRETGKRSSGALTHTSPQPPAAQEFTAEPAPVRRASASSRSSDEFRPSLKRRPEDRIEPMSIDPTLRTDLLAKVQGVNLQGGNRNLFQFGAPPPPPLPKEPPIEVKRMQELAKEEAAKKAALPPPPPPPPPITFKYYGYSSARGDTRKRAFFLDGDEILVAAEGEMVKKRYKVVRIGVNSVVMEDTQFKHEQTLPLQAEAAG